MTALQQALAEQARCAAYLRDDALCREWAATYGCTVEQARAGAAAGIEDWLMEECLIRADLR